MVEKLDWVFTVTHNFRATMLEFITGVIVVLIAKPDSLLVGVLLFMAGMYFCDVAKAAYWHLRSKYIQEIALDPKMDIAYLLFSGEIKSIKDNNEGLWYALFGKKVTLVWQAAKAAGMPGV